MTDTVFGGLRVVDLSTGMAGSLATMVLADYGADVVKVEPPGGDWARALPGFLMWSRGKRSAALDLGDPAQRDRVIELVAGTDVVVDSFLPGRAEAFGLDRTALVAEHPALVWCSITGFGRYQGVGTVKPFEGIVAAATGRLVGLDRLSGGHPGVDYGRPAFTAAPVATFGASQLALQGIVAALLQRRRIGRGQLVETSLLAGAVAFMMRQELARATPGPGGSDDASAHLSPAAHRGIEMCFTTAECADGRYIQMCARQDDHFRSWLAATGLSHVLDDPVYAAAPLGIPTVAAVDALEERLRERMRTRTQAEWMRVFTEDHDVGADPFLTPAEFLQHPDMVANGRIADVDDPVVGRVRQLGPLVEMSETPARVTGSAPALGAHTDEVLAEARQRAAAPAPGPPPAAAPDGRPPLAGFTVLEVAYYIAGPLATTILAEMGANVIKVEPQGGDPYRRTGLQSAKFVQGKRSVVLDLKTPAGREALTRLIRRSDAVVHSFRAGPARRLGVDAAGVRAVNTRAVHLYAGSYGSNGPQASRAAFHSTPNALSGGGIKQAGRGAPPVNDSYPDPGSALGAATALLLGLYARERIGRAPAMETTMLCSTGYIHAPDMVLFGGAPAWPVADEGQHGLGPRYRLYPCADGWLFLAAVTDGAWGALAAALGVDSAAVAPDDELAKLVGDVLAERSAAEWAAVLEAAGVPAAVAEERPMDTWLEEEGFLRPAAHPAYGAYWRLPPRVLFSGSDPVEGAAAAAGEHTRSVLAEVGFGPDEIDDMVSRGVAQQWEGPGGQDGAPA